jgi:glucose/arabinose dehydrogenase
MKVMQRVCLFLSWFALIQFSAAGQKGLPATKTTEATVATNFPQHDDFSLEKVKDLDVTSGFELNVAAQGLGKPRMLAVDEKGRLYITRRDQGDVLLLSDADGNGRFDQLQTVANNFKGVHGIAIYNGKIYLASNRELKCAKLKTDGTLDQLEMLIDDLPDGGQHGNRTIAFGPDSMLYITVGSTCNDCNETNKENATVLRASADGKKREIFARGLRNTIGIDWDNKGELWGADNGTDWRGDEIPPEEINHIKFGEDYGWPMVYGKQLVDQTREDPLGATKEEYAKTTQPSEFELPAHSAPINFLFLKNVTSLPAEMKDDAIVTLHGSWNKSKPDGYKIIRVVFENGKPIRHENFLAGFISDDGKTRFGRPAGLAISKNGDIFISDDANGTIYRMSYTGKDTAKK